jgi:hypothetical protein
MDVVYNNPATIFGQSMIQNQDLSFFHISGTSGKTQS